MENNELKHLLIAYKSTVIGLQTAHDEILSLFSVVVPKGTLCKHDYQPDITCGVDITACTKCGDVI